MVDYFVELSDLTQDVNTLDIKHIFHESLMELPQEITEIPEDDLNDEDDNLREDDEERSKIPKNTVSLGKFKIDPVSTDFIGNSLFLHFFWKMMLHLKIKCFWKAICKKTHRAAPAGRFSSLMFLNSLFSISNYFDGKKIARG